MNEKPEGHVINAPLAKQVSINQYGVPRKAREWFWIGFGFTAGILAALALVTAGGEFLRLLGVG